MTDKQYDTFYDDINKDRASLTQKWMIFFLLNASFVFHFYIIWKIMIPEYYYTVCWVYQKAKRKKVNFLMVWFRISIVLSLSVLYRIVKK